MTGLTNYSANNLLNGLSGLVPVPTLASVFMALFTAVGTDAGTGFTEATGNGYARVQVAGALAATAAFTTASPNITMTTNPGWIVPGMTVYDVTNGFSIGTVLTFTGTSLVLTANAAHASSGSTDSLSFSAFPQASGTSPASIANVATNAFPAATSTGWGNAIAWGFYDALSAGNLTFWDYLGNYAWLPATVSSASPGIITAKAHGYAAGDVVVFSTEYGGTAPSFSASNFTGQLVVVSPTTDTFSVTNTATPVNTSSTGSGSVRKVLAQTIPGGVTASFAPGSLTVSAA